METTVDLIIDERYLFNCYQIYDLKNNSLQTIHENIPPEIKDNDYNSWRKMFYINEKQFIIYYF